MSARIQPALVPCEELQREQFNPENKEMQNTTNKREAEILISIHSEMRMKPKINRANHKLIYNSMPTMWEQKNTSRQICGYL